MLIDFYWCNTSFFFLSLCSIDKIYIFIISNVCLRFTVHALSPLAALAGLLLLGNADNDSREPERCSPFLSPRTSKRPMPGSHLDDSSMLRQLWPETEYWCKNTNRAQRRLYPLTSKSTRWPLKPITVTDLKTKVRAKHLLAVSTLQLTPFFHFANS